MGHTPGFPCLHSDPGHDGKCSTPVEGSVVDPEATRYFQVSSSVGVQYWRINPTARVGAQVEHLRPGGRWETSWLLGTADEFLADTANANRRDITAEDVPGVSAEARDEIAEDVLRERTEDARDRYEEVPN